MLSLFALCLAVCGAEDPGKSVAKSPGETSREAAEVRRPFHEIQNELSDLLKREALTKDAAERGDLIRRMCTLHRELLRNPRHEYAEAMKGYRAQVWARLKRIQTDLKNQLARVARERRVKEPQLGTDPELLAASDSLAASLNLVDSSLSGPSALLAYGGRAGPADYGPDLVDLIERTINPDFWDTNGGPGTIVYFAPLRCLVITATGEMHQNVGGLVGGLRAAGE
jgi:hypothetical protein